MTRTADLSGSEQRLVEYPEFDLATATSTQLAGSTGTSRSTIDRLARKFASGGHTRRSFLALIVAILTMGASKKKARKVKKYRWVTAHGGDIPSGAAPNGNEATGESLYVCRANYEGGLYPGKIRGAYGAANIPYNGKEVKVTPYEVLMDKGTWVAASGGQVPPGAVAWGHEANGEALYVCRAHYEGGLHPGKVRSAFGAANIPYNGLEVKVNPYEVLVGGSE